MRSTRRYILIRRDNFLMRFFKKKKKRLTQTIGSDSIEKFNERKAQVQQQEQEQIPWIFVGKYQPFPFVQFILDAMTKTAFILVRQWQHIDGNNCEAV